MSNITGEDMEVFAPTEDEKLEILVALFNGDYTVEALREDYEEEKENAKWVSNA